MLHHMTELAKSHAMLREDNITLKKRVVTLQADHETLKGDHEALKESHAAKLKAIVPLLKGHPTDSVMSHIYTILAEYSSVKLMKSSNLLCLISTRSISFWLNQDILNSSSNWNG